MESDRVRLLACRGVCTLGWRPWQAVLGEEGLLRPPSKSFLEIASHQALTLEIMAFEATSTPGECALKKMRYLPGHLPRKKRACEVLPGKRCGWCARSQSTLHPVCLRAPHAPLMKPMPDR